MKRILIADDNKKITAALSARLRSAGYDTIAVHDGFAALQMAIDHKPDIILLDIWMPGMGLAVAERLNQLGLRIPVIVLTASQKKGLWAAAQAVGAVAFVQKPYESRQLLHTIERTLHSRPPNIAA